MNRFWSMPRTHRKRSSWLTSGITSGSRDRGDAAGDAAAERHPRPADLVAIEAVRRGERQVLGVAIEEVQRRDARPERVARLVDDRLEELLPRARGRRHARHAMEEPQLVELLLGGVARAAPPGSGSGWAVSVTPPR